MHSLLKKCQGLVSLFIILLMCMGCSRVVSTSYNPWEIINLPTEAKLIDIAFVDMSHGYLVGSQTTLLETQDGGRNWHPIKLDLDKTNYRFNSISFYGEEGWIVGEPSLNLHTTDAGASWLQIPLSEQLPGNPISIVALDANTAEMATDIGAIYKTTDGGKNWKAQVTQAVGVVRNLERSDNGQYVAVSAKGNFYSVWQPGNEAWESHNRNSSRRIENMGFTKNGHMWMLARGGQIQFTKPDNSNEWLDTEYPEFATSWGLLDLAYRTPEEIWVSGGSGNLLRSSNGGKTWEKDRDVENVPANLYKIVFLSSEEGFVISDHGILLRYNPTVARINPEAT